MYEHTNSNQNKWREHHCFWINRNDYKFTEKSWKEVGEKWTIPTRNQKHTRLNVRDLCLSIFTAVILIALEILRFLGNAILITSIWNISLWSALKLEWCQELAVPNKLLLISASEWPLNLLFRQINTLTFQDRKAWIGHREQAGRFSRPDPN